MSDIRLYGGILTDEFVPIVDGVPVALYRLRHPSLPLVEDAPAEARRKLLLAKSRVDEGSSKCPTTSDAALVKIENSQVVVGVGHVRPVLDRLLERRLRLLGAAPLRQDVGQVAISWKERRRSLRNWKGESSI